MEKGRTPNDIILEGVSSGAITKDDATILLDAIYKNRPVGLPYFDWTVRPYGDWTYKPDEQPPWTIINNAGK